MRAQAIILLLFCVYPALHGQTVKSLLDEVEKNKERLTEYGLWQWNKDITSKKKCFVNNNGKKLNAIACYNKDSELVKLMLLPKKPSQRMQVCFVKSNGWYIGAAFYVAGAGLDDRTEEWNYPWIRTPRPEAQYSYFQNVYIYLPASNDLYIINYETHHKRGDTLTAEKMMQMIREQITGLYYFKSDLLGASKYIQPVSAIGIFGLEPWRHQYTEARQNVPVIYGSAPAADYEGIKNMFYKDSAVVSNAYFIDVATHKAYTTMVLFDSLPQLSLDNIQSKNLGLNPVPGNIVKRPADYVIKFSTSFDILSIGRETVISRSEGSVW